MPTTSATRSSAPRTRRAPARATTARRAASTPVSAFASDMPATPSRRTRAIATPMHVDVMPTPHLDVCVNCAHLPMSANMLITILAAFTIAVSSVLLASSVIIGAQASRIEALQGVPPAGPVAQR